MALDFFTAEITELTVFLDSKPKSRDGRPVLWATVQIHFAVGGLNPDINIHVPLKWVPGSSSAVRKADALRCAKLLLGNAYSFDFEKYPEGKSDHPNANRARA